MDISLYIATSLDGRIADADGGLDWLSVVREPGEDYGYPAFLDSVQALILGSRTCERVLAWGEWPWPGKPAWVLSSRALSCALPEVTVTACSPRQLCEELAMLGIRHAWLVGGAETATAFMRAGYISRYILSVVPVILGEGPLLFGPATGRRHLRLLEHRRFRSGLVQLTYEDVSVVERHGHGRAGGRELV